MLVCNYLNYKISMQDEKAFPKTIPGAFQRVNHFFIPQFGVSHQVFLPSTMVFKIASSDNLSPGNQNCPYDLQSDSTSVDPEVTIGTLDTSRKDASSQGFLSEQQKAWDDIKYANRKQEYTKRREVEDRQRRQHKAIQELNLRDTSNIDVTILDEEKQRKLYEEAQLQNRKQNLGQTGNDHHTHGSSFGQQQPQQPVSTGSSHPENHQNSPNWYPMANQGHVAEHYNVPVTQQTFQEHQQPPAQPPTSQYSSQFYASQGHQPPYSQPTAAQQMAHIPRVGIVDNVAPMYVPSSGTQHEIYNSNKQRPRFHYDYDDEILGQPNQFAHSNQQSEYSNPADNIANYNPHNLELGSMIQYGNPLRYGVIKWVGHLPGPTTSLVAGVEMVSMCK